MTDWKAIQKAVLDAQEKRRSTTYPTLAQGFTLERDGRCGEIYYRKDDNILEIPWEMSGVEDYDILILPLEITSWNHPQQKAIERAEREQIIGDLETWLKAKKIRADAFAPLKRPLFPDKK